jgi:hypothetical protein
VVSVTPRPCFTPKERTPGTHWMGWVALRAGLDAGARREILCPSRGSNPGRSVRRQTLHCLCYRFRIKFYVNNLMWHFCYKFICSAISRFTSLIRSPNLLVRRKLVKRKLISHYFPTGTTICLREEEARKAKISRGFNERKLIKRLLVSRGVTATCSPPPPRKEASQPRRPRRRLPIRVTFLFDTASYNDRRKNRCSKVTNE